MLITINNKKFTDNSKEANNEVAFVYSAQNEKFCDDAKNNGCNELIASENLKDYVDFSKIKVIGITGTNGKTTTAAAIYSILLDLGYKVALQGTRGFFINDKKIEDYTLTTPVQLANFEHIQKAIDNQCDFFVTEVSSHAIQQKRIEGIDFELKVHTNITRDHLDYHKTIQEYINVKNSFFNDETKKLINRDDKIVKFNTKNAYTYSLDNPSTYKVGAYSFKNGMNVMFSNIEKMHSFSSLMMGIFNIYNLMAAIASVHLTTNRNLDEICEVVENFAGVSGRMEVVSNNPLIIIDFAHTPDGMKEVYESFNHKDIITVFGAGGNRDKEKRPLMGQIAAKYAKQIIVTSDNPRFEDPDLIIEDICTGIKDKSNLLIEVNRKEAIKKAIEQAKKNENSVLLILGKGDEPYQIIYDKKLPLIDKDEVLKHI
ncbi:UDP-N-acetylmuramoyl-L-alanyl-D-glutamate--2,6-diaminopimelate ligase [Malaciobacter molluscorum LMG 25693]|uniref:UDP-N-acetylmuramoyl-L-alanyl-D-glutamate--2,6-diaminopimelate ligase n=1 Tax=Malaciobacter molluscorum LMG 25693 TaxID=870501 RepID=A0A2G1DJL3_9BACT|nr:UDP-N-acetylmuramoyl-L-alanyl-D-glutamate--2,6-diaminopimelate ligase [Malaciobacter molluscorum]AXX91565.1 UDP-N-acetylmuramoylalanyl-D-glutamate 2,6-diaminopimelate ligase [Malaciobacter molluscorum LMG 25693]PHO18640.1 UDP-N-acetylmuramoyl-L-alanyl-D-glutamate--2,6-diaminopimelate ligase [Malaciobacter molluscorum LMG 25693]RXJ94529.1 UDP-N-acetylmuramoyl-L-alanyl-D-glutamate--2,6-diaminopimelate ligase [Malaciobacter molluscorum]